MSATSSLVRPEWRLIAEAIGSNGLGGGDAIEGPFIALSEASSIAASATFSGFGAINA